MRLNPVKAWGDLPAETLVDWVRLTDDYGNELELSADLDPSNIDRWTPWDMALHFIADDKARVLS